MVIGVDPGVRFLASVALVTPDGGLARSRQFSGDGHVRVLTHYLQGDGAIRSSEAEAAREEIRARYWAVAKYVADAAATYHGVVCVDYEPVGPRSLPTAWENTSMGSPQWHPYQYLPLQDMAAFMRQALKSRQCPEPVIRSFPYSSQTCPVCGRTDRRSRQDARFSCVACRYEADADVNAAHMIGLLGWGLLRGTEPTPTADILVSGARRGDADRVALAPP